MTRPVSYLQTDPRWKNRDYSAKGESTTIGASGCGPTAMAMVLATWADPAVDPASECAWALAHGYKAPHQGTYYGYFTKAAARYGLRCTMLNGASLYGNAGSGYHEKAKAALEAGGLVIACMGPGNWTRSGHYVLVWRIDGEVIHINDPASTLARRTEGSYALFRRQVKYYWTIDPPERKEEDPMDIEKLLEALTPEQAYRLVQKAELYAKDLPEPSWSVREGHWHRAEQAGVLGGSPERYVRRDELAAVLGRKGLV